jgi:hypothetical protein
MLPVRSLVRREDALRKIRRGGKTLLANGRQPLAKKVLFDTIARFFVLSI